MLGDCKRNNEIRHERIDRPTGGAIRFFNNKENEWKEKIIRRPTLAIQQRAYRGDLIFTFLSMI